MSIKLKHGKWVQIDGGIATVTAVDQSRKPREFWIVGDHIYVSRKVAEMANTTLFPAQMEIIHVREVLP